MNTTDGVLVKVTADMAQTRRAIADALAFVASVTSEQDAAEAYDRVRLAKEWAKIRKIGEQMHQDLLRLEIHCLRKIARLGSLTVIPSAYRSAARYFEPMTDREIDALIDKHGERLSPVGLRRRATMDAEYEAGKEYVHGGKYRETKRHYSEDVVAEEVTKHLIDTKAALASILADYEQEGADFSISELTEEIFARVGADEREFTWGVQEAMSEVCRKAVRDGPDDIILGTDVPRFITCLDRHSDDPDNRNWIRVPFAVATVEQLRDMVQLRWQQHQAAEATYLRLADLLEQFDGAVLDDDGTYGVPTLGALAMRLGHAQAKPATRKKTA